ncbi:choice-of-anchor E domain-containing protein [Pseudoduganella danionis]|uniref:Choice-of-anchor E domain-containing protein n=1 Tax=Pseudoduganella danionis TaxID=1890295 RepID=A0ABW9ST17_9BURK|nr:choice-of-anchor E domain-containing protein [Pseudoduganella danionis]MTW33494.1 choice-of-anchor E domain-containing protein [Pseudoduganella danionis]
MKLNKITSAVLVAASLMAGAAHAKTEVYELSKIDSTKVNLVDVLMTFQGFDPAKGILTAVSLDIYSDIDASVALANKNTSDRTLNVSVPASLKLVAPGATLSTSATLLNTALWVGPKINGVAGTASESEKYTLHASTSFSGADLLLFKTAGTLTSELSVSASTTLTEDKVKAVYSNFANGYGHVTYTFDAAPVPEPETYGMLLAGLAMLGLVAKRNKRSA